MEPHTYPSFEELHTAPDYLTIGASAMHALRAVCPKKNNTVRDLDPEARRAYDRNQRRNWAGRRRVI